MLDVLGRPDYYESDFAKRAVKEIDDSQLGYVFIRTPYVDDIPKGQSVSAFCVNNRRIVHTSDEYRKMCAYYSCDDFDEEDEYCRKWAARIPVR